MNESLTFEELWFALDAFHFLLSRFAKDESFKTILKYYMTDVIDAINSLPYEC